MCAANMPINVEENSSVSERLFPHPSCLPSHEVQLFSTSYILHKTDVVGQFSEKTRANILFS